MMVVDTSALMAVLFDEPERADFLARIRRSPRALICSANVLELRMVVRGRRGERAVLLLDDFIRQAPFEWVAPGEVEVNAAYAAFVLYGKGSGHAAGLNFGDVFSYALAKTRGLPLLFKGDDFAATDIEPAWRPAA
jgi:ribonuclease VapC